MKKPWPAFFWVCFTMCAGVMSTALISPLYGLYKDAWQLLPSDISLIYVTYMAGAMAGLLFMGRMSDFMPFHKVMRIAIILVFTGTFLSMVAWNTSSLNMGRFMVGLASSLMSTSASVGLTFMALKRFPKRAAMISSTLLALGFGLGPLLGGIAGQWLPWPLVTAYIPTLILCAVALYALERIEITGFKAVEKQLHWRQFLPRFVWTARADSQAFILTSLCSFLAFGIFGLYASMAPLFIDQIVPWKGPLISGLTVAVILLLSALIQTLVSGLAVHICGFLGFMTLAASCMLLLLNLSFPSTWLLVTGVFCTASGHALCLLAGITMVNRLAAAGSQSGLIATYFSIGYSGSMLPILGVGWIADHWGLMTAVSLFCYLSATIGIVGGLMFWRHPRMRSAR